MEKWKEIKEYENLYLISNYGRIKGIVKKGNWKEKILSPYKTRNGYYAIKLFKENKPKNFRINRLVATAFLPNLNNKEYVNHKNGNKLDNRVSNLEWVTASENSQHAWDNGLMVSVNGEKSHYSKLTNKEVNEIRRLRKFFLLRELGVMYNVTTTTISDICNGKTWKHLLEVA